MEKLLHEKLRECDKWKCTGRLLAEVIGCEESECIGISCSACIATLIDKFVDEIERCYIPRPRDNKGIPFVEGETVWSIDTDTEYSADVVKVNADSLYLYWEDGSYDWADAYDMQHEKPQEPDSLEKLMDDATKPQRQYYNDFIGHDVGLRDDEEVNVAVHTHIINRAIAIERGA